MKACHSTAFQSHCTFECSPYHIDLKRAILPTDHQFPPVCQSGLPLMWKRIWIQASEWRRLWESPTKYFVTPPRCSWKHLLQSQRTAERIKIVVQSLFETKTHAKNGASRQGYWEGLVQGTVSFLAAGVDITGWSDVSELCDVPVLSSFASPSCSQTFTEHTSRCEDAGQGGEKNPVSHPAGSLAQTTLTTHRPFLTSILSCRRTIWLDWIIQKHP